MSSRKHVSVVGAGIGGLTAAIACAEAGRHVTVFESLPAAGGRARTTDGPWRADLGPHALYADGPMWAWLEARGLLPETNGPAPVSFATGGVVYGTPPDALVRAAVSLPPSAPVDQSFRAWALAHVDHAAADAAVGLLSLVTFDADPGRFSAAWCRGWLDRLFQAASPVRYVTGGWQRLVDRLAGHAGALGVSILTNHPVRELPPPPVVVATSMAGARRLLDDPGLTQEDTRVVLHDVGFASAKGDGDPPAVLDLDRRVYAPRYTAGDRARAPEGCELVQAMAGSPPGERLDEGVARIEAVLDDAYPGWRGRARWRRSKRLASCTGAVQLPGTTWEDRPPVDQGGGVYLVGDAVAAPGHLSEVSWASAMTAAACITGANAVA